jgi:hypothetical protein
MRDGDEAYREMMARKNAMRAARRAANELEQIVLNLKVEHDLVLAREQVADRRDLEDAKQAWAILRRLSIRK